jgi:type I restriction enzyme S subunit
MFDKLPEEWRTVKVEDIAAPDKYTCVGGPFGSNLTRQDYIERPGVPVSRGNNLTLGERLFNDDDFVFVSKEKATSLIQNTAYPGDIVFTQRGTIGQVALIPKNSRFPKYILSQNQMKLTLDSTKADVGFLLYYFLSPIAQEIILRNSIGSTIPGFNLTQLRQFPVPLPPLPEQKAIAHILGTLDDKIELNREMNKTLEAMARAIFKSWFVDFDPVRAKMEGRQPAGMDAATAELFPDEFEESALGMVPKGWKVIKLGDLIDIKHGYAFKGEFFRTEPPGDILLTPGNFAIGGGFKDDKFKYYLGEVPEEFVLDQGDLLVTMTDLSKAGDTLGYPAIIPAPRGSHYLHNQRLGKVIIKSGVSLSKLHLYYLLCTDAYRHEILASATGTTVKHTSPDRIKAFDFLFPNNDISLIFGKFLTPSYNKIILNQEESLSLASIRDTLLPKLLSGEIRVKEAEKIVETQL